MKMEVVSEIGKIHRLITFNFSGYATTVVGPGPKGVGDKVGGLH